MKGGILQDNKNQLHICVIYLSDSVPYFKLLYANISLIYNAIWIIYFPMILREHILYQSQ